MIEPGNYSHTATFQEPEKNQLRMLATRSKGTDPMEPRISLNPDKLYASTVMGLVGRLTDEEWERVKEYRETGRF